MVWVREAIERLGHQCVPIHDRDDLADADGECDLIIFQHKGVVRWPNLRELCERRKTPWVQWWFDLIAREPMKQLHEQVLFCEYHNFMSRIDAVFVKEQEFLDEYRARDVNAFYLDQGCPAHIPEIVRSDPPEWDLLLWGQAGRTYKRREKHVREFAARGYRVAWATHAGTLPDRVVRLSWCHPEELWKLAGRSQFVLSIDLVSRIAGYASDRFWLACGMGCAVLQQCEHPRHYDGPVNTYRQVDDAHKILQKQWEHAPANGKALRKWVMQQHTIEHRLREMFDVLVMEGILAATVAGEGLCSSRQSPDGKSGAACVANAAM